ncbi:MAG: hypothetical protein ACFBSE_20195 [Prochloraceae cyanobacterium]
MQLAIGGIIGFLIGAAVLFFVQKNKIDRKEKQLQQMQKKLEQSEQDYESRLRDTVMSLQAESQTETRKEVEKIKQTNQVIIEELEQENLNKIEELERSNLTHIQELEESHQAKIQELEESHQAKIQELEESHQIQLEKAVNSLKEEYQNQLQQLELAQGETKTKTEAFEDLLEGLPSFDIDGESFNDRDSFAEGTGSGLTELLKIAPDNPSLPDTDLNLEDNNDEIQQLADFFEDLPSFDDEPLDLDLDFELESDRIKNNDDASLDIEQKPLEEEIKRLSDLLDAFPPITEEQDAENKNSKN